MARAQAGLEAMGQKICVDSDVLINFLRNEPEAVAFINDHKDKELATTTINIFELYRGAYHTRAQRHNLWVVEHLLRKLTVLPFTDLAAKYAGEMYAELAGQGNTLDMRDLFIGVTAMVHGFTIKTNNKKDFSRIEGLQLC